ncbi:DNA alkylation repair protein [Subtercola lobariae]|uniref:DNA alkylation repair protein n=1 Tax=Subtercola lobariae TaxID=1588641 RepID=A0A917EZ28_9MICO|nr:DNA alkylation repair protein [Subtercola lobariae]GGF35801.1 hypothetical protein GCM10011399_30970 [Subtercola lobariae]
MPTADELLGPDVLARLIGVLEGVLPGHPFAALRASAEKLPPLALRQRSELLKDALLSDLPGSAAELAATVRVAMTDARFTGWLIWPVTEAVSARALEPPVRPDDFDDALALLAELTPRLTAEFAIRGLLQADLARALPTILSWVQSPDPHVRRLASEGTRAFLPWAKRVAALLENPESTLPIINALYRDESDYVRRSVANHLNDLSRQSPDLAASVAAEWMLAPDANTAHVVRHGLRSLVKKGHGATMALFGFSPNHGVAVTGPVLRATEPPDPVVLDPAHLDSALLGRALLGRGLLDSVPLNPVPLDPVPLNPLPLVEVTIGDELAFSVSLTNPTAQPATLVVDYVVHHRKANGTQTTKVFKLTTTTLGPGQSVTYERRHSFKRITTRTYHPGEHAIEVQVNGVASGRTAFLLRADQLPGP